MSQALTSGLKIGREMDPDLAMLTGEGAQQRVKQAEPDAGSIVPLWQRISSRPAESLPDYYRLPLLKEPVWIWSVPAYFYLGGVAGGCAVLAAALPGKRRFDALASWCRLLACAGVTVGPALLTWDLGKMTRFLNMLRVFRPSSPMSVGSWSLAGTGMLATLSLLLGKKAPSSVRYGTALGGVMVAGYTGVLLGNTANPLWLEKRRLLPPLFISSAIASTAGALELLPLNLHEEKVVQRFGMVGKVGEAAAMVAMERRTPANKEAVYGFEKGRGGLLWNAAKVALVAGVVLDLIPAKSSTRRKASGLLTTLGAICLRYALLETGKDAAREPQAVIGPQRRRMQGGE
ncbi:NrfD/PsrC family molybdoenzyme membrane anchor subunit [Citrifermentans bremense]|uniref:NrfD/PsrC family molybdoenzyme membrane anchor subunit n=1 Tax=Citrifermentans bremense TaxID=60035 RepID=UPI00041FDED6|nr:NrfD/PsrC family molybdoenzyme membrane anchor subunit [Citrifermentans bremense]